MICFGRHDSFGMTLLSIGDTLPMLTCVLTSPIELLLPLNSDLLDLLPLAERDPKSSLS